jgi:hypothetical protein
MMKLILKLAALVILIIAASCNKSEDDKPAEVPTGQRVILVGNEGGFGAGNASLSLISTSESTVSNNVYSDANEGAIVGDVLNSIGQFNDKLFLVLNNSEKIEVVNSSNFERTMTIAISSGSPRYISFASESVAYVSDLYGGGLHVVNPRTGGYESFIDLSNSVEHLLLNDDELWAGESIDANFNPGDEIIIVNTQTNSEAENIELSAGVNKLVEDSDGKIWVLCSGDGFASPAIPGYLYRIDPASKQVEASWELPQVTGYAPVGLAISPNREELYYVMQGKVYKMNISDNELPTTPFIEPGLTALYTIHCAEQTGQIALTDVKDYSQDGTVHIYDSNGSEIGTYTTEIIPNAVHWMDN